MCGIIGSFNNKETIKVVRSGLKLMKRGKDGDNVYFKENFALGHSLHSIVGHVKQPIVKKGVLVFNGEIYNWEELNKKYKLKAKNDSELLSLLLEKKDLEKVLEELDGVYAFGYLRDDKLVLVRDIIGVKPIWFSFVKGFSFASEGKVLENSIELNPRKILDYDVSNNKFKFKEREFFKIKPEMKKNINETVEKLLEESVKKRIPSKKFGLLFSGGIDSVVLALLFKKLKCKFRCYVAGIGNSSDVEYAIKVAKELELDLEVVKIKENEVEKYLKKIIPLIEDTNVVKVGVALPFFIACEEMKEKVVFSGLGSEEIFAGYERHKNSRNVNEECLSGLLKMYERDLYRDDVVTMYNGLELRLPYLDKKLVEYSLKVNEKFKLNKDRNKIILRDIGKKLGLSEEISERKKKAAQYGSGFHKILKKLSKKNGFRYISEYLRGFYKDHNLKLGALVSSGKDSIYAMYVMMRQNYDVNCMIGIKSKNKDSFMFHSPVEMVEKQSEAIGIDFLMGETEGNKEDELKDLKKVLEEAKKKYGIEGVITGALFSNYQRERIEKVCDELGLKIFSPLWHMDQELEMRQMIEDGFEFIFVKIAADGLSKKWLGKVIDSKDIDKLVKLNEKIGLNVAGEGGETESLVLNCPLFKKKLKIKSKVKEESENVAELEIKDVELVKKRL
ncbi:ATP-binding protein [archaeon]|nr:ATP-binding protein [archaeon]|tara:strand:- start:94 stop:2112 length:2019 start_codon:yes stop_codon:yes gene_type:complete